MQRSSAKIPSSVVGEEIGEVKNSNPSKRCIKGIVCMSVRLHVAQWPSQFPDNFQQWYGSENEKKVVVADVATITTRIRLGRGKGPTSKVAIKTFASETEFLSRGLQRYGEMPFSPQLTKFGLFCVGSNLRFHSAPRLQDEKLFFSWA